MSGSKRFDRWWFLQLVVAAIGLVAIGLIVALVASWLLPVDPPSWLSRGLGLPLVTVWYLAGRTTEVIGRKQAEGSQAGDPDPG